MGLSTGAGVGAALGPSEGVQEGDDPCRGAPEISAVNVHTTAP